MFSTPLTCCSIGAATVSATTWALAPGYEQDTCTVGGVMSGYWAIGSEGIATPPASTMTIDSTAAKIGRSMKKREITSAAFVESLAEPNPFQSRRTREAIGFVGILRSAMRRRSP